jgi:hypothetical protein
VIDGLVNPNDVFFFVVVVGPQDLIDDVAIVGEKDQAFRVFVEAANGKYPFGIIHETDDIVLDV